jgi:hypothetical protein
MSLQTMPILRTTNGNQFRRGANKCRPKTQANCHRGQSILSAKECATHICRCRLLNRAKQLLTSITIAKKLLKERAPRLAKWARDCAKNDGQPSMSMLDRLEAERIESETTRKLWSAYDDKAWSENLCRADLAATLTERGHFETAVANSNPWLLKVHRAEAKAGSPRALFDSLTFCMKLAKRDPKVREIHRAAGETLAQWKAEQQEAA